MTYIWVILYNQWDVDHGGVVTSLAEDDGYFTSESDAARFVDSTNAAALKKDYQDHCERGQMMHDRLVDHYETFRRANELLAMEPGNAQLPAPSHPGEYRPVGMAQFMQNRRADYLSYEKLEPHTMK